MGNDWKLVLSALIVAFILVFFIANPVLINSLTTTFDAENVKTYVLSFGVAAPVIFILLHILQTVVAPIPGAILVIAGGLIWGAYLGTLLSVIGAFTGSLICFWLSRTLGRPFVEKFAKKEDLEFTDKFFQKYGIPAIILLRLIPLMAFDVISYGAGMTKMDFKKYATATLIGMIPSTLFYSYIGFTIGDNSLIAIILAIAVLVVFFLMGTIRRLLLK